MVKMMDMWRSEEMQLLQLIIPSESAHATISALGEVGMLQFRDLNSDKSAFQRRYASQVKRCDEMARKLRFFTDQVEKAGLFTGSRLDIDLSSARGMDELEVRLADLERELLDMNANNERLERTYDELVELEIVLNRAGAFFEDVRSLARGGLQDITNPLLGGGAPELEQAFAAGGSRLGFAVGMVATEKLGIFERVLFRATRGNMFFQYRELDAPLRDPSTREMVEKAVFVVFFAGDRARTKMMKICDAFGANRYPFPEDFDARRGMLAQVSTRLNELSTAIASAARLRDATLQQVAESLDAWVSYCKREKATYHTLNKLSVDVSQKALVGEAWCPRDARAEVQAAVRQAGERAHSAVGTIVQTLAAKDQPPTFFRTSKITSAFQTIVDAYGIARYREVNPAPFTIVTFPFLFAVMFGDVGHGILMLLFVLWLISRERAWTGKKLDDIMEMMFGGRYVLLLMAIFSIYTGLLYNEFFSMPMNIFGNSRYACPGEEKVNDKGFTVCEEAYDAGLERPEGVLPYPFGVDPVWHGTRSELPFLNSMKMKMSIVMGVTQMTLGIVCSFYNHRYFGDTLSILYEFIPQMLFLHGMFGYLCFLIIYKWVSGSTANIYHILIYWFLEPGNVDCSGSCPENLLFPGQGALQNFLLVVLLVSLPVMLLPKPLILRARHNARGAGGGGYATIDVDSNNGDIEGDAGGLDAGRGADSAHGHGHGEEFDFGEVFVHQIIHTIEFALGAISNTASYLRLWALSLAHAQLSAVFYDRVLMLGLQARSPALLMVAFFVFMIFTIGVLMVMETLSAFLHALRLHWVEYMNKFYSGDGYSFVPFAFARLEMEDL
ncbi:unnamed protein product [Pedinophyceae sp. YPF-701]|nr:unnamed protein product [Pedinophyceae sp. YPF-701]